MPRKTWTAGPVTPPARQMLYCASFIGKSFGSKLTDMIWFILIYMRFQTLRYILQQGTQPEVYDPGGGGHGAMTSN